MQVGGRTKGKAKGIDALGFQGPYHLLNIQPWKSLFICSTFSFSICKNAPMTGKGVA